MCVLIEGIDRSIVKGATVVDEWNDEDDEEYDEYENDGSSFLQRRKNFIPYIFLPLPLFFSSFFYSSPSIRISIEPLHPIDLPKIKEGIRCFFFLFFLMFCHYF
jgi:hypothetical protein